jgi:hypothetical protein
MFWAVPCGTSIAHLCACSCVCAHVCLRVCVCVRARPWKEAIRCLGMRRVPIFRKCMHQCCVWCFVWRYAHKMYVCVCVCVYVCNICARAYKHTNENIHTHAYIPANDISFSCLAYIQCVAVSVASNSTQTISWPEGTLKRRTKSAYLLIWFKDCAPQLTACTLRNCTHTKLLFHTQNCICTHKIVFPHTQNCIFTNTKLYLHTQNYMRFKV